VRVAIRLEGGIGDHLLGNRFVRGIQDEYPKASFDLFSETQGETKQSSILTSLFNYYDNTFLLDRENTKHMMESQFGTEDRPQHISNTAQSQYDIMESYDRLYDLHIDALDWLSYDFDWQRYFYSFPRPTNPVPSGGEKGEYLVLQLASDNLANGHRMSETYIRGLISELSQDLKLFILSTPSTRGFLNNVIDESPQVSIFEEDLNKVISLIKDCAGFLGVDSGIKYLGYTFNKPTLCWARESMRPHSVTYAHQVRWLTFPQLFLPLECDAKYVKDCMKNLIKSNNFFIAPQLGPDKLNRAILRREVKPL
jgi:ADP-heptose:LPS heptosyltransferase